MRLLVTRPRPDAEPFAQALAACGIESAIEPMIDIIDLPGPPIPRRNEQAILFTSANGPRALQRRNSGDLSALAALPVYAVGDATAKAARAAGFRQVDSASGDVAALTALVLARLSPQEGPLLHVAGSQLAGDLAGRLTAAGFIVNRAAIYAARKATALSAATQEGLRLGLFDGVTFFSPRTAAAFVTLCCDCGVVAHLRDVAAICLSQAVAQAVSGVTWRIVLVAPRPDQDALLGCLGDGALRSAKAGMGSVMPAARENT